MRLRPQSLTARVLLVSTVWAVAALVVIGVVISALYRQGSERGFQDLLRAQLYNVINSIVVNDKSVLAGSPQLGDLRFSQPQTGWYWIVEPHRGIQYAAADVDLARLGQAADCQP